VSGGGKDRVVDESVWLSAGQIAELIQRDNSTISRHIQNAFEEGELTWDSVVALFATTAVDRESYQVERFVLDVFAGNTPISFPLNCCKKWNS